MLLSFIASRLLDSLTHSYSVHLNLTQFSSFPIFSQIIQYSTCEPFFLLFVPLLSWVESNSRIVDYAIVRVSKNQSIDISDIFFHQIFSSWTSVSAWNIKLLLLLLLSSSSSSLLIGHKIGCAPKIWKRRIGVIYYIFYVAIHSYWEPKRKKRSEGDISGGKMRWDETQFDSTARKLVTERPTDRPTGMAWIRIFRFGCRWATPKPPVISDDDEFVIILTLSLIDSI